MVKKQSYSEPKVCKTGKTWYVHFRIINPKTGKREQYRAKFGINWIENKAERNREAQALCEALKIKLKDGWNPFTGDPVGKLRLKEALESNCELNWKFLRARTRYDYTNFLEKFIKWLTENNLADVYPEEFTYTDAIAYMDSLAKNGMSGNTYNNNLTRIKTFFRYLVDRDIIVKNPFARIKKQVESVGKKNTAYSDYELKIIKSYLRENNLRLFYFTQWIYYTAIRPGELCLLKVGSIDFSTYSLNIPADISKNKKGESVVIPKSLQLIIEEMQLNKAPKDAFIFDKRLSVGYEQQKRTHTYAQILKPIVKKLGINQNCTIYSFKHSGLIALYKATNHDIYAVSRHARHSSLEITQIYLKSLGFVDNKSVRAAVY